MVIALLGLLSAAQAGSLTVAPVVGVVGDRYTGGTGIGVRPGFRLGFEPSPLAALEVQGTAGLDQRWEGGLGLSGRLWAAGTHDDGVFLLGRMDAGLSGDPRAIGPWLGGFVGFGGRANGLLNVEATVGPEWTTVSGVHGVSGTNGARGSRWRTDLSVGVVLDGDRFGSSGGTTRHKPRKPR